MLIKIVRALGWIAVTAGILIFGVCAAMILSRSPDDFEGMLTGAAIGGIVLIALPTFVAGVVVLGFASKKCSETAT